MSRAEHDAMVQGGRVQPDLYGVDMKHVTAPPDAEAFRAAKIGSVFVEFDVSDTSQIVSGDKGGWLIIYGPNSFHGRRAARNGLTIAPLPLVQNIVIVQEKVNA